MQTLWKLSMTILLLTLGWLASMGCATSTLESRRQERSAAYQALPSEQKELVDQGQIQVGLSEDAVYIAWGRPAEVLESESEQGHTTTWIYQGQSVEELRYWTYRQAPHSDPSFFERHMESDYYPRNFVRAEVQFVNKRVVRWRTFPKPY